MRKRNPSYVMKKYIWISCCNVRGDLKTHDHATERHAEKGNGNCVILVNGKDKRGVCIAEAQPVGRDCPTGAQHCQQKCSLLLSDVKVS